MYFTALNLRKIITTASRQLQVISRINQYCTVNASLKDVEENDLPEYEVSTKEMKYVDRLMPQLTVPEPPKHSLYPTPSGWLPQLESSLGLPYYVRRTKNHMLPVYMEVSCNTRHCVIIKKIDGDMWALESELKKYLQELYPEKNIVSQVHEVSRKIRFKGQFISDVSNFLIDKGF